MYVCVCVCVCVCVWGGGGGGGGGRGLPHRKEGVLVAPFWDPFKNKVLDFLLVCSVSKK